MPPSYLTLHHSLQTWYHQHGRTDLPWRITRDPYAIWLSEVMLQQTQVKTVLERYYFPFLEHFPTLQALADADLQDVLKAWEGLGYYRRARNLHKAAQLAAPTLPDTVEGLLALPGIGRNTAHAVAAFAFHRPVAVMEANVKRVICRFFALEQPTEKQLWQGATELLDSAHPFDHNQAMMDLGALICTKTTPNCNTCPLAEMCQGKANPIHYPQAKQKKATPIRQRDITVYHNNANQFHLTQRTGEFLHGLYGFAEQPRGSVKGNPLGSIRQVYSHFTLEADIYLQAIPAHPMQDSGWFSLAEIAQLPLSKADSKVVELLGCIENVEKEEHECA